MFFQNQLLQKLHKIPRERSVVEDKIWKTADCCPEDSQK